MKGYLKSIIAIIILVILWFAFTGWNKHKSRTEAKKNEAKSAATILKLKPSAIESFTLASSDGKSVTCVRQGKTWSITKPLPIPADQTKVASFLDSLTSATIDQKIAPHPSDLKDFGLAPAAHTVQVTSNSTPANFTLLLGNETPTSSGVYAQVEGQPQVFTITDDEKASLEKTLFDLRDTRAVTLNTDQIDKIHVQSGNQTYTLIKNPEGVWDVSLPPNVRADHFAVEGLVDSLQSLTMQSVVAETQSDDPKYGLNKPTLVAKLITPDGTQTLTIGKAASSGFYAVNSALAPIFTLDESSVTQFEKSASDFRDKNFFSGDMFNVKTLEITTPAGHWAFAQNKNVWKQTAPSSKATSSDFVSALLDELRSLQASSFPPAKPGQMNQFGFGKPAYTFKVTFGAKNQTQVVDIAQANGHDYARRASDPLPGEIASSDFTTIENDVKKLTK